MPTKQITVERFSVVSAKPFAEVVRAIEAQVGHPDIHQFSALAVEKVSILPGTKKPVKIFVEMNDTAGIFQVEHQLLQKITDVGATDLVEIHVKFQDGREVKYLN